METGIEIIAKERKRQVEEEGYTSEYDDRQEDGSLANASAVYAMTPDKLDEFIESGYTIMEVVWPWDNQFYKPSKGNIYTSENPPQENIDNRIHELAKAGALIAAEIDRLLRLKNK